MSGVNRWFDRGEAIEQMHRPRHRWLSRRCWTTSGGPTAHLRVLWFNLRVWWVHEDGKCAWHRITRCRFGHHHWVPYWVPTASSSADTDGAPDGLLCWDCGAPEMLASPSVADAEEAIEDLIVACDLVPTDLPACPDCGSEMPVLATPEGREPGCHLCWVEGLFMHLRQSTPNPKRKGHRGV